MGYSRKLYSTQNIITIISVKAKTFVQYSYKNCNSDYDLDWKISYFPDGDKFMTQLCENQYGYGVRDLDANSKAFKSLKPALSSG